MSPREVTVKKLTKGYYFLAVFNHDVIKNDGGLSDQSIRNERWKACGKGMVALKGRMCMFIELTRERRREALQSCLRRQVYSPSLPCDYTVL